MFQTGYLTLKERTEGIYTLGYPNSEVEKSWSYNLLEGMSYQNMTKTSEGLAGILIGLRSKDIEKIINTLKSFFASIPYQLSPRKKGPAKSEAYYHLMFYSVFKGLGLDIECEIPVHKGRIDAIIKTKNYIYIFEFKVGKSAKEALKQIKAQKYHEKYLSDVRPKYLIGINFSIKERNIDKYLVEEIKG
jgi:hypothetical protein